MKVKAAAKINLMLDILRKLDNGYHSLFMIMQSVDLCDTVAVEKNSENKIIIKCDKEGIPLDNKNIAYKCAERFFDHFGESGRGITINIEKRIPAAAGIAGGSADGAAVLYCLNKIYGKNLTDFELAAIGSRVGADIPFSLIGGTAAAFDTGSVVAPLPPLADCKIVIVTPPQEVSTPAAYAQFDRLTRVRHTDRTGMLNAAVCGDYKRMCSMCANVFEQAVEVPRRPHIKSVMRKFGADAACMSGSGPTVFGLFSDSEKAEQCVEKLKESYERVYLCAPLKKGIIEI